MEVGTVMAGFDDWHNAVGKRMQVIDLRERGR